MSSKHGAGKGKKQKPLKNSSGGKETQSRASWNFTGDRYNQEEIDFLKAIDKYKRERRKQHITDHEAFAILLALGYRKESV